VSRKRSLSSSSESDDDLQAYADAEFKSQLNEIEEDELLSQGKAR